MNIIEKHIDELIPYENNPRHNEDAVQYVANSIKEFGFKVPIIIDKNDVIVAGHTRLLAAKDLDMDTVPCIVADDLTEEQVKAFRIADNKVAEYSTWDDELLQLELGDIGEFDMGDFGFELDFIKEEEKEIIEDVIPEEAPTRAKPGDLWQLGEHRLICGDCTDAMTLEKLMGGEEADLVITDPPYNVDLGITDIEEAKKRRRRTDGAVIQNDAMSDGEFYDFLSESLKNASAVCKQGASFYVWHPDSKGLIFRQVMEDIGVPIRQNLIWVKNSLVLGRQDYQWIHEPCLYGWKDGAGHYFINDRTKITVIDDTEDVSKMKKERLIEIVKDLIKYQKTTVMHENKPSRSEAHPTMKPVRLIANQIINSSRREENVLDIFGGSGTTLIAAEQLNRRCFMVELDPHYCDVIIKRWENLTGNTAERIG